MFHQLPINSPSVRLISVIITYCFFPQINSIIIVNLNSVILIALVLQEIFPFMFGIPIILDPSDYILPNEFSLSLTLTTLFHSLMP